jgi:hypothetical protein
MFVEIRNPNGVELLKYRLTGSHISNERISLTFAMDVREGGPMEWMLHEVRPRYNTSDWSRAPRPAHDTRLELELRPVQRSIGSRSTPGSPTNTITAALGPDLQNP